MAEQAQVFDRERYNQLVNDLAGYWGVRADGVLDLAQSFIAHPQGTPVPYAKVVEFLMVCREHRLNPATKEIYGFYSFDKKEGYWKLTCGVTADGWVKLMNEHPKADGFDVEYHFEKPHDTLAHSCTVSVYRKDRSHPARMTLLMREWSRDTWPWKGQPNWQLALKAIKHVARLAFGFAGVVDIDEVEQPQQIATQTTQQAALSDRSTAGDKMLDELGVSAGVPTHGHARAAAPVETSSESKTSKRKAKEQKIEPPEESHDEPPIEDGPADGEASSIFDDDAQAAPQQSAPAATTYQNEVTQQSAAEFARWFNERRKARKMPVSRASSALELTVNEVAKIESADLATLRTLPYATVLKIADTLGKDDKGNGESARAQVVAWLNPKETREKSSK